MNFRFRFCPSCAKPIKLKDSRLLECRSCGFKFYLSPASTNALILVNEKGEILLTKRKFAPRKGFWDLPGGFVDRKETVEESLVREIHEELGIKIKGYEYLGSYWSYYPYKGIKYQTLCHAFWAKYEGGEIKAQDDVSEIRFFPFKEIPIDKLSFKDIKEAVKDFILHPRI